MPEAPFEADRKLAHRRRSRVFAAAAVGVASAAGYLVFLATTPQFGDALVTTLALLAVATIVVFRLVSSRRRPRTALTHVRADARGLAANGALLVARDALRAGYVQPRASGLPVVHLECRPSFESVDVEVENAEEGTKLLAALGLDASRAVVHFRVYRGILANNRAQAIFSGIIGSSSYAVWLLTPAHHRLPFMVAYFALVLLNLWPSRMSIGADGVLVTSLRTRRFYPFANVASVEASPWGIVLVTGRGERVEIRTRTRALRDASASDDATRAIVTRIRAGVDALTSTTTPDAAALVGRGARTYDAWIDALRELGRDGHYRSAALPPAALWNVLEDPAAEASARAGAAMALRASLDGEGRERVRVASAASASPHVRIALDVISRAEADDAALREALEACDADGDVLEGRSLT